MAVQLDTAGGQLLKQKIEDLGVTVHTGKNTQNIVDNSGGGSEKTDATLTMQFADGDSLDTDLILFSAGIRPQDALGKQARLALGERGGVLIDNECRTSVANIFAIGECAVWDNKVFGLVAPGYTMASICADIIAGDKERQFVGQT